MADLMPRIRMPKVTLPGRSDSAGSPRDKAAAATKPTAEARTKPATGAKEAQARTTEATRESAKEPTKGDEPEPNLQERMEGLQGWMAEIERKQGRLTYFGIAGIVFALLAGGAALYIGLAAKNDSATKDDVDALTKKVDAAAGGGHEELEGDAERAQRLRRPAAGVDLRPAEAAVAERGQHRHPAEPGDSGRLRQGRGRGHDARRGAHAWGDHDHHAQEALAPDRARFVAFATKLRVPGHACPAVALA